jgi:hypothetical protein
MLSPNCSGYEINYTLIQYYARQPSCINLMCPSNGCVSQITFSINLCATSAYQLYVYLIFLCCRWNCNCFEIFRSCCWIRFSRHFPPSSTCTQMTKIIKQILPCKMATVYVWVQRLLGKQFCQNDLWIRVPHYKAGKCEKNSMAFPVSRSIRCATLATIDFETFLYFPLRYYLTN